MNQAALSHISLQGMVKVFVHLRQLVLSIAELLIQRGHDGRSETKDLENVFGEHDFFGCALHDDLTAAQGDDGIDITRGMFEIVRPC